ncbi:MAG TPA: coenzyme F420 hydrogenase subunit alpha [Methanomicrobia archaeon]|nr:coenzyme F420 hydrogenase subunit alpha [Methanomicrobia archaeon]
MSTTTFEINPATRIEGHAKIVLETNEEDIIENAYFMSTSMVRGFEYLVRGRHYNFATLVTQRICGICPIPHGLASAEAIEDAMGVTPPRNAMILRELLLLANKIQSHALHQYLILPDLPVDDAVRVEMTERIQEIRRLSQKIVDTVGGEAIHPSNIEVGGMRAPITAYAAAMLYRVLRKCERLVKIQRDDMIALLEKMSEESEHPMGRYREAMLATDMTYGNRERFDLSAITEITPYRFYQEHEPGKETHIMIPLYYGETVEVGPRARFSHFKGFRGETPIDINIARAREMMIMVYRAVEILDDLSPTAPTRADIVVKKGSGIGVVEAPRGTNAHMVSVDDSGTITAYNMIVPTTWNMPTVERALRGNHHSLAEFIVRSYDPCVECATHCIEVRDLDGNVTERRMM